MKWLSFAQQHALIFLNKSQDYPKEGAHLSAPNIFQSDSSNSIIIIINAATATICQSRKARTGEAEQHLRRTSPCRSSPKPRGMDKMIRTATGDLIIINDGATILKHISALHPAAARMLVDLAAAQDVEAGDGTTTVVVLAGAFLGAAQRLLETGGGVHPGQIGEAFLMAAREARRLLGIASSADPTVSAVSESNNPSSISSLCRAVKVADREEMVRIAATSLCSKIVAPCAPLVAGIAVDAVAKIAGGGDVIPDLSDIRIVGRTGGAIEDIQLVDGILLGQPVGGGRGIAAAPPEMPRRVERGRVGLVQFHLSSPKTDMEGQVVVKDYQQMDRILREERTHILNLCKRIKKAGCTVLLVQKSILREGVSELALHYLSKLRIMCVADLERDEIEWIGRALGIRPIADPEGFVEERLGLVELAVEEDVSPTAKLVRIVPMAAAASPRGTASILVRGGSEAVVGEVERSLHDALCVVRSLYRLPQVIVGGGAAEVHLAVRLSEWSRGLASGPASLAVAAYAEALLAIPTVLAENAGMDPIAVVTELRNLHSGSASSSYGINVRRAGVADLGGPEGVYQPLLVTASALQLATETVAMILKIDDMVQTR